jgi:acetyl-CoA acetyltransferase
LLCSSLLGTSSFPIVSLFKELSRAIHAIEAGLFRDEIVNVEVLGKKVLTVFERDQQPRADTSAESLANLRPAFKKATWSRRVTRPASTTVQTWSW